MASGQVSGPEKTRGQAFFGILPIRANEDKGKMILVPLPKNMESLLYLGPKKTGRSPNDRFYYRSTSPIMRSLYRGPEIASGDNA